MSEKVYCLLDGIETLKTGCAHVFATLTDPSEVELCRTCEYHPLATSPVVPSEVEAPVFADADPDTAGSDVTDVDALRVAAPVFPKSAPKPARGSIKQAIAALASASGASFGSVSSFYYAAKSGKSMPGGPMAKAVREVMESAGVTWSDIGKGVIVPAAPRPDPAFPMPESTPESDQGSSPAPKFTECCILARPVPMEVNADTSTPALPTSLDPAPQGNAPDSADADRQLKTCDDVAREVFCPGEKSDKPDEDPDEPSTSLDPVEEAARYGLTLPGHPGQVARDYAACTYGGGQASAPSQDVKEDSATPTLPTIRRIDIPEFFLREPTFEEVLVEMKRRLPVGTKITIEL